MILEPIGEAKWSGPQYDSRASVQDHSCQLVDLDYANSNIYGTLIKAADKQIYVSADGMTISLKIVDAIIVWGIENHIENVELLGPAGIVVVWDIQGSWYRPSLGVLLRFVFETADPVEQDAKRQKHHRNGEERNSEEINLTLVLKDILFAHQAHSKASEGRDASGN